MSIHLTVEPQNQAATVQNLWNQILNKSFYFKLTFYFITVTKNILTYGNTKFRRTL